MKWDKDENEDGQYPWTVQTCACKNAHTVFTLKQEGRKMESKTHCLIRRRTAAGFIMIVLWMITVALAELVARFCGLSPYVPIEFQMEGVVMEPKPLFILDSLLGYRLDTGTYRVYYADGTYWQTTHDMRGQRITSHSGKLSVSETDSRPAIHILGCSFTHGSGLSDEETYPFLLQSALPGFRVYNHAVAGYGVVNAYLQIKELIQADSGDIVLYAYIGEHDNRYTRRAFKKLHPSREAFRNIRFLSADTSLNISYYGYSYSPWPLISHLALVNTAENLYLRHLDGEAEKHLISERIVFNMMSMCRRKGAVFVFAGISNDRETGDMLRFCSENGIPAVDISVDLNDNQYNLMPYDDHPNAEANSLYKNGIIEFLRQKGLVPPDQTE